MGTAERARGRAHAVLAALAVARRGSGVWSPVRSGLVLVGVVLAGGTVGYLLLGLSLLDAAYQTVITVFTVGFREVGEVSAAYKAFTIVLVIVGVGTVLYTATVLLESLIEGRLSEDLRKRRMQQRIDNFSGHVIVCGLGQVGAALTESLRAAGRTVVVVDRAPEPLATVGGEAVLGDATDDAVLERAGVSRASTLVVAMDSDADNLYVTLSARSVNPAMFIVARANKATAEPKLRQAGADRVVNPHRASGARMAALVTQPHVADFLDVVMHDRELEVRLAEVVIGAASPFVGRTMADCAVRERSGATVLALRHPRGFDTNPRPEVTLAVGDVVIALGTDGQLRALRSLVGPPLE